jgi:glycosyltransferase involved in cell wall biosynthesis
MPSSVTNVTVQVIVPARNEEDCIGRCLESLVTQQGISFEITVVDDGSADRTRAIAQSFPGVRVISSTEPLPGVSGKCNALIAGSQGCHADWLLFTDADTFHYPGSLASAVAEAEQRGVDLLSYSPEQEVVSFAERALMPLVFAELVLNYQPERINDPSQPDAAANGQYLLVRRTVYELLNGHQSVQNKILEDLELARLFKASDKKICFRYGQGLVRARMYRSFRAMCEGWTKNLTLLFDQPLWLAWNRFEEFLLLLALPLGSFAAWKLHRPLVTAVLALIFAFMYARFLMRVRRAHFRWSDNLLSCLGLPLFVSLLLRSWLHSQIRGAVTWKGRTYSHSEAKPASDSSISTGA